ncbi:hypothetical protein L9F63_012944, partial [Diploptera punctata]
FMKLHERGIRKRIYNRNLPPKYEDVDKSTPSVEIIYVAPLLAVFVSGMATSLLILILELILWHKIQKHC